MSNTHSSTLSVVSEEYKLAYNPALTTLMVKINFRRVFKMSKIKSEMATRCELAMMGKVVPIRDNSEVQPMTEYIVTAIKGEADLVDIVKESINRYHENKVKYLVCNTVHGMPCITYLLDSGVFEDSEDYYPEPFASDYGTGYPCAFCYVFNLDNDWCSEFGDCFFVKKSDGYFHRVS